MPFRSLESPTFQANKHIPEPTNKGRENLPNKTGPRPETVARINEVAKKIVKGEPKTNILEYIQKKWNLSLDQARRYYYCACRSLIPEDQEEYRQALIQNNIERLEKIIEEGMKDNANLRVAKEAISELNKMLGIGGNKVVISNDSQNNTQTIEVNFG